MAEDVRRTVQELVAEILRLKKVPKSPEEIKEGVSFTRALGLDSLDILQMTAKLEKALRLRIPEDELKGMDDLGTVLRVIAKHRPPAG